MKSPWEFKNHGKSGIPVSALFPNVATCVDDLCVVRSMVGDSVAHGGALLQLHTGSNTFTRPSMGSWIVYGLGSENKNLPGFHYHQTVAGPRWRQELEFGFPSGRLSGHRHWQCRNEGEGTGRTH